MGKRPPAPAQSAARERRPCLTGRGNEAPPIRRGDVPVRAGQGGVGRPCPRLKTTERSGARDKQSGRSPLATVSRSRREETKDFLRFRGQFPARGTGRGVAFGWRGRVPGL
ncbi:hypothetical protein SEVIR_5G032401v4 [Setaria viridis]